jgi:hypothetical protein
MLGRLDELASQRQDFAIETTLASRSLRPRISIADGWQMADNSWPDAQRPIASRNVGGPIRIENFELWQRLSRGAMKPAQKAEQQVQRAPAPTFNADEVFEAIYQAGREAVARHKALGQSIVIWRDGKVVVVPPEEIEI